MNEIQDLFQSDCGVINEYLSMTYILDIINDKHKCYQSNLVRNNGFIKKCQHVYFIGSLRSDEHMKKKRILNNDNIFCTTKKTKIIQNDEIINIIHINFELLSYSLFRYIIPNYQLSDITRFMNTIFRHISLFCYLIVSELIIDWFIRFLHILCQTSTCLNLTSPLNIAHSIVE